jgi:hypothetical protein
MTLPGLSGKPKTQAEGEIRCIQQGACSLGPLLWPTGVNVAGSVECPGLCLPTREVRGLIFIIANSGLSSRKIGRHCASGDRCEARRQGRPGRDECKDALMGVGPSKRAGSGRTD